MCQAALLAYIILLAAIWLLYWNVLSLLFPGVRALGQFPTQDG